MSLLNNDKKVLDKGRKNTLKDAKASLRDQIVVKLAKKLEADNVGQKVSELWLSGNANRQEWLDRQSEYLATWDEHLDTDIRGPFQGSSSLHLPTLFIVVKTMHARFLQAILGVDPPFNLKARTEASNDRVSMVSDTMRYAVKKWANRYQGVEEMVDKWIWSWISTGSGILKWGWDCDYTRYIDVVEVEKDDTPLLQVDQASGKEILIPRKKMVEEEQEITKKTFEGPTCHFVEVEDLLIVGGGGDPDRADAVLHQDYLDSSQLWTLVDRGVFSEDAVEKVISGGSDYQAQQDTSGLKYQKSQNAGQAMADNEYDHDRYQVIEAHMKYDVDGSGIFSDIVVWVHPRSRAILKATYLRRMNKAGERPFKKIDFHVRNGQEYGMGMVEILYPLAKEMDAMHNMRIDFGLISTMPFGFYRPSSSINPETINLEPGALIPVDNPSTDVFFPNLGNRTVFGFQEEAALQQMIDRVTSISDLNLGVINGQGATRTATGTRAVLGESSANLDVYLRRVGRGWRRSLEYLLHMLQQRAPRGLSFRVTGDDGADYWRQLKSSDELQGDYDIEVSENSATSNKQIQLDNAQQILQITANPLDIQLGIINASNRYNAVKNYLQTMGVKDYGRFATKPQGYSLALTPAEEANRLLRGIPVPITPEMDHQGFIDFVDMIQGEDELLGQFNEQETIQLELQKRKHAQMMEAIQFAQAQAANAAQMQQNAAMSQQQAPVGQNPMANPGAGASGGQPNGAQS